MAKFRKILKITGIVLLVFIAVLFAAPYIFKGRIVKIVKEQINRNINARTDFSDVDLSFFRHFPKVSLAIQNLSIVGRDQFGGDTLISAKEIDVAVNLFSVLNTEDMKVSSVTVSEPRILAKIDRDGKANWDIAMPAPEEAGDTAAASPFRLNLQHYAIRNGYVRYVDLPGNMSSTIEHLDHEGSGDFTADVFTLHTQTRAGAVSFVYGGIPYLASVKTQLDADIQVDNPSSKYSFKTDQISLNDLKLAAEGFFQLVNDSTYQMDISYRAPSTDFRSILSLIPSIYQQDFASIKTSGKAVFDGFVKGTYSPSRIPAYAINLEVNDGFFQYPDLPQPVQHINLQAKVNNPDGVTDHTEVNIPRAHIEFGTDPFDFSLLLRKPVTDQYIEAAAKGKLGLAGVSKFVKLDPGTRLGGVVNADLNASGNLAVVMQQKPGNFSAKGFLDIQNLLYGSSDFPQPVQHTSARINIENPDGIADHTLVDIPRAHVEVGNDAADLTLKLRTPASDPDFSGTINGTLNLANLQQFYAFEAGTKLEGILKAAMSFAGRKSMIDKENYDALKLDGALTGNNIRYASKDYPDGLVLKNMELGFAPRVVSLRSLNGTYQSTGFSASGVFNNLIGFAMKDEPLAGNLQLKADKVDLNRLMGSSTESGDSAAATAPFAVPANINFTVVSMVDQLHYDKVDYRNIKGTLRINDETVTLNDMNMDALDGHMAISGSYSTKVSKLKPDISLQYQLKDLDVQKTFYAFNTVQQLMPIGKFISGKLNSELSMKGKLGDDMMPDLGTLTGDGYLFLIEGFLSKFQPLEKMASTLHVTDLQQISVRDIKSYFEFANGKVLVKPFHVKVKDIDMEIGGMHGLDQSIDYAINLKMPREKLGPQANQLINGLAAQASSKGIPVKLGDEVSLRVNMGGTITNPQIKTDLQNTGSNLADEMKDQVKELVEAKKQAADSAVAVARAEAKDSLESVKKSLVSDAADALKKQLSGNKSADSSEAAKKDSKQKVEESAKGLLNSLLKKKNKKESDTAKKGQ